MYIELVEFLRCPANHAETHCVLATANVRGRDVVRGVIGCPKCRREYTINRSIAEFGHPPKVSPPAGNLPDAGDVHALLGLDSPGGYAVLVGSAAGLAPALAGVMEGIRLIAVNSAAPLKPSEQLSLLETESVIPLRTSMARGLVLGAEYIDGSWIEESRRVLLPGLRLVVLDASVEAPGMEKMTTGRGMWVGRKPTR